MRKLVYLLLLVEVAAGAFAFFAGRRLLAGPCVRIGSSLTIPAGARCEGDALVAGGDLVVRGTVEGHAIALCGGVWVEGRVEGDVVSLGGASTLLSGAHVSGNATVLGGPLHQAAGAAVEGNVLETVWAIRRVSGRSDRLAVPLAQRAAVVGAAGLVGAGLGWAIALGMRGIWPHRTASAIATARSAWPESLGLGFAVTLFLFGVVPLLVGVFLRGAWGVVLLPPLFLALFVVYSLGLLLTGVALGEVLGAPVALPAWLRSAAGLLLVAGAVLLPAIWVPEWALPAALVVSAPGLGALLLSRAGTKRPAS